EPDNEIRTEDPVLVAVSGDMGREVAVREHPYRLDRVLELQLAPATVDRRRAQRGDESARLQPKLVVRLGHRLEVRRQRADVLAASSLERLHLGADLFEGLLPRRPK